MIMRSVLYHLVALSPSEKDTHSIEGSTLLAVSSVALEAPMEVPPGAAQHNRNGD